MKHNGGVSDAEAFLYYRYRHFCRENGGFPRIATSVSLPGKTVAGYKPVAKGSKETPEGLRNKDALVLQSVSTIELPYEAVNPIALSEEESSVAHSCPINYTLISNGLANLTDKVDHVVVEGTGGWRSLMNDLRPLSEWVVQEQLPVLMLSGIQEGCINHALLTAQAIANDGLPLIGWVANRINQDWRIMRNH